MSKKRALFQILINLSFSIPFIIGVAIYKYTNNQLPFYIGLVLTAMLMKIYMPKRTRRGIGWKKKK